MKKNILIAFLVAFSAAGMLTAANYTKDVVDVLRSEKGQEILHPGAVGKSYKRLASTTGVVVCTGKCLLFDVIMASGAASSYVLVADTYTADSTDGLVFSAPFVAAGSKSVSDGSNAFPILFDSGITLDLSSASAGENAVAVYKDLD
jgi:hypothetical protein